MIPATEFDAIIIGAGINGAGISRDAAMRGLKVLLLDKGDLGCGTSSWSTRLIHGGLRYLEHGELGLVRESLREREILLAIAPHLVRPLSLMIPIYADSRRGRWTVRAGMIAYDLLSFDKTLPRHQLVSSMAALQQVPGLNPASLLGAVVYHDAQVEFAERLIVENVLSARKHGATVRTYCRVDHFVIEHSVVRGVQFIDVSSGERHTARSRLVINASGPWVDQVLSTTDVSSPQLIGGTKGSHIVVGAFPGAPATALYVEARTDHRPYFVIPWNGHFLIGTTDIRYQGDLDRVEADETEIEYLLNETNHLIPSANLRPESILYSYSGIRPLAFAETEDEQSLTRRHFVREHPQLSGLVSIVGGKLTTYRGLAQEAVDLCFRKLGRPAARCLTGSEPLPGAKDLAAFREEFAKESAMAGETRERLLRIYGVRAAEILQLAQSDSGLCDVFDSETGAIAAEVVFAFEQESAQTLADCLLRRTMVGLNSTCGLAAVEAAAHVAGTYLGWSEEHAKEQVQAYQNYVARFHPNVR